MLHASCRAIFLVSCFAAGYTEFKIRNHFPLLARRAPLLSISRGNGMAMSSIRVSREDLIEGTAEIMRECLQGRIETARLRAPGCAVSISCIAWHARAALVAEPRACAVPAHFPSSSVSKERRALRMGFAVHRLAMAIAPCDENGVHWIYSGLAFLLRENRVQLADLVLPTVDDHNLQRESVVLTEYARRCHTEATRCSKFSKIQCRLTHFVNRAKFQVDEAAIL
eukprot:6214742-Pleurochrysis_carterae.AAC.1